MKFYRKMYHILPSLWNSIDIRLKIYYNKYAIVYERKNTMIFRPSTLTIPLIMFMLSASVWILLHEKCKNVQRFPKCSLPKLGNTAYGVTLSAICSAGQFLCYWLSDLFVENCMAPAENLLPITVMLLISLLSTASLLLHLFGISGTPKRLSAQCTVLSLVLLVAEIGVFNGKSICTDYQEQTIPYTEMEVGTPDLVKPEVGGAIHITGNAQINLYDLPSYTRAVSVVAVQGEEKNNFRIQVKMKDDNYSQEYIAVGDKLTKGGKYPCDFAILPYGELHSIQLQFLDVYQRTVRLTSVTVMSALPFSFSLWRYLVLFGIFALVLAVRITGFARVRYDHRNRAHRIMAASMMVVCVSTMLFYHVPEQEFVHYPLEKSLSEYDAYTQTFDAFQKGQVWLDIEPDPGLAELENVYDRNIRARSGYPALWDRAYFEGKYYSYFGITPVLLLYYPVYWITGSLPSIVTVNEFFAVFAILFLCLAIQAAMRLFAPRANLLLMLLLMPFMTCICGVYYCFHYPDQYGAAVASALCFTFASLWLGCSACLTEHKTLKFVQLAACGLCIGLAVGSRPSMAISALVLAPVFLSILLDKQSPLRFRLQQAGAFLLPVIHCAAGLMYYNHLRFGSPFDFGASYQLTVSDIHANKLRLSALPAAFMHYFLHIPSMRNAFPFFGMMGVGTANYQMYTYVDIIIGAYFTPILLMGTFLLPSSLRMQPQSSMVLRLRERGFLIGCFVMALFIAWADFCLAGIHLRYLFDIMPVLILGSACTILRTTTHRRKTQYGLVILTGILSMIVVWAIMLTDRANTTAVKFPYLFEQLEDLVIFWQ